MNTSYVPKGPEKGAGGFMEQACTIVLAFFLYSFTGWLCESIYCSLPAGRFINRGFLTGPLCPVYGFGALLIVFLLSPLQPQPVLLFLAGAVVTSLLEYVTGFLLEKIFHTKLWDYSQRRFNLHGRVCLKHSLLFGAMGLVTVYLLHPFVLDLIGRLPLILLVGLAGGALAAFLLDLIFSVRTMLQLNGKLAELERVAADLRQKGQLTHERLKSEVQERFQAISQQTKRRRIRMVAGLQLLQRRMLDAFPTMRSVRHHDSLVRLREYLAEKRAELKRLKK